MANEYRKRGEDTEQEAVMSWAHWNTQKYPALKWLFHIPNGGKRNKAEAARFKAQGVKAGASDLFLPQPSGKYAGLFIEMKYGKNVPTQKQEEFMADMKLAGYSVHVAYGADEAIRHIERYLTRTDEAGSESRTADIHQVKILPKFFEEVKAGRKPFELRVNDRNYKVGDTLVVNECTDGWYTGRCIAGEITYILENHAGLMPGYCILGLRILGEGRG